MKRPVEFYSEGFKLYGDVYAPDDLTPGEKRIAVLLCHGYTGVKDLYLPDNANALNRAGYVAMTFDYKGWGDSEGTRNRLAPYSRVMDVQAAITFLGLPARGGRRAHRPLRDQLRRRDGFLGRSGGPAGQVHRERGWRRKRRSLDEPCPTGGRMVRPVGAFRRGPGKTRHHRGVRIRGPERHPAPRPPIGGVGRSRPPQQPGGGGHHPPIEYVDDTLGFNPEWIVDKISPRPILFITSDNDRLVLPEESEQLYAHAGEPKKLVVLKGYGHYEVYAEPAFSEVMAETLAWFGEYL